MAARLGVSYTTVRYWMTSHGLATTRAHKAGRDRARPGRGRERPAARPATSTARSRLIRAWDARLPLPRSAAARRSPPAGAGSSSCSSRSTAARASAAATRGSLAALHFHHVDPATKSFALAARGVGRSIAAARAEVAKCVLLCANCHAEVEAGRRCRPIPPTMSAAPHAAPLRSGVAQWQSIRLLTEGLWVRVPPPELIRRPPSRGRSSFRRPGRSSRVGAAAAGRIVVTTGLASALRPIPPSGAGLKVPTTLLSRERAAPARRHQPRSGPLPGRSRAARRTGGRRSQRLLTSP